MGCRCNPRTSSTMLVLDVHGATPWLEYDAKLPSLRPQHPVITHIVHPECTTKERNSFMGRNSTPFPDPPSLLGTPKCTPPDVKILDTPLDVSPA